MTLEPLLRDTQHAIRRLLHDWRFTSAAVLILGLGIGANTALFSVINATMFRSQSLVDAARLVDIYQNGINAGGVDANSYPAYLDNDRRSRPGRTQRHDQHRHVTDSRSRRCQL